MQLIHRFNFVLEETETEIVVVVILEAHLLTNLQQVTKEDLFYRHCCIILIDKKNIPSASTSLVNKKQELFSSLFHNTQ